MLTGPLRPFPATPGVETRATVPMDLLPWEGLVAQSALSSPVLVEIATRFPDGVAGVCPICSGPTTGVVSVGVQLAAASATSPAYGPLNIVLEGSRPRSYRLEPCGCALKVC